MPVRPLKSCWIYFIKIKKKNKMKRHTQKKKMLASCQKKLSVPLTLDKTILHTFYRKLPLVFHSKIKINTSTTMASSYFYKALVSERCVLLFAEKMHSRPSFLASREFHYKFQSSKRFLHQQTPSKCQLCS